MSGFLLEEQLLSQVKEFTTPKTIYEHMFTICLLFWIPISILFDTELLRFLLFGISILMIFFSLVERIKTKEMPISRTSSNLIKFFIASLLIGLWGKQIHIEWIEEITTDFKYYEIEKLTGLAALVLAGFLIASNFNALSKNDPTGYFFSLFRGLWSGGLLFLIFLGLDYAGFITTVYDSINPDLILAIVLTCQIIGSQAPPKSILPSSPSNAILQTSGVVPSLPGFGTGTRLERLRDSFFSAGLTGVIFYLLGWVEEDIWIEFGLIAIVGFFILMFASFQQQKTVRNRLESAINQIKESPGFQDIQTSTNVALEKLSSEDPSIQLKEALEVVEPTKILKSKLDLNPGTALVPIAESASSITCQMLKMGENAAKSAKELPVVVIPRKEWENFATSQALVRFVPDTNKLKEFGLENIDTLKEITRDSLKSIQSRMQKLTSFDISNALANYGVSSNSLGTKVSLPGIKLIEDNSLGLTMVKVPFVQVLDAGKKGNLVKAPGVAVLDTPTIDVVKAFGISVLDTKKGSIVNIAGFKIRDGDIDEAEVLLDAAEQLNQLKQFATQSHMLQGFEEGFIFTKELPLPDTKLLESGEETSIHRKKRKTHGHRRRSRDHLDKERPISTSILPGGEKLEILEPDEKYSSICPICEEEVIDRSTMCPYCGQEFHYNHWKDYISKRQECPVCLRRIKL